MVASWARMDARFLYGSPGERTRSASISRGLFAALCATVAVSLAMLLKQALNFMPGVDLVMDLGNALGHRSAAAGWAAHFIIGVIAWGLLFVWVDRYVQFPHWINGVWFSSVIWLGVMVLILPAAGRGLFGTKLALGTPTVTLFLHWIYGLVLGTVYGLLQPRPERVHHGMSTPPSASRPHSA